MAPLPISHLSQLFFPFRNTGHLLLMDFFPLLSVLTSFSIHDETFYLMTAKFVSFLEGPLSKDLL